MTQRPEYVGCMDGSTIVVRRQADEIVLIIGGVEARLSREAAIRLANLLPSATPSSRPSNKRRRTTHVLVKRRTYPETITDLIEEGLIQVGTLITMRYKNVDRFGTITVDGMIDIDGHKEETPSGACIWVTGRQTCNGWAEWKLRDGKSFADLRWMLRAKRFPGGNHEYAELTTGEKQKQMIATGWVDYALVRGLDPSKEDKAKMEAYLVDRQLKSDYHYTESTLNVYRAHLRHWFNDYSGGDDKYESPSPLSTTGG